MDFFHSDLSFDCLNNLFRLQFAICPEFRVTILSVFCCSFLQFSRLSISLRIVVITF